MPSKSRIQLYADECFPVPAVTYLKSLGFSIVHAYDKKYVQKSDRFHLNVSKKLKRILITLDRDFNYYEQVPLKGYPGVIIISVGSATLPSIIRVCVRMLKNIGNDYVKKSLIKVTYSKLVKIRGGVIVSEKIVEN